ncbi:phosphatidate cytidylyltransferase [Aestuariivirga litoralis]|uniref:phosphatidate cytidylyltransferase n=1 Tax=Aestuariivirga litoralis TaxID=2650924 RepID=UPI0018C46468|nr:phosphatidate cytidylyltransferase [Aestuariivirga litoralis]MBG1231729.1 phosphatidate cytidylyltransferase [Aestuariivirga litoralis]
MTVDTPTAKSGKWGDLGLRSLSAIILMPVAIYCLWEGGIWFQMFMGVLAVLIAYEWAGIVHGGSERAFAVLALAGLCGVFVTETQGLDSACLAILVLWLVSALMWLVNAGQGSIWSLLGVFYVSLPMIAFVLLREDEQSGRWAVVWCFAVVWGADIFAYFFGRIIGGPKLAPTLSPKKTWAGLLGAVVGAALVSAVLAGFWGLMILPLVLIAAAAALVEQAGDIFESALKRRYGVKDSGNFIPGHGGVLDRVDGLLAVVLFVAVLGFIHRAGNAAGGLLLW